MNELLKLINPINYNFSEIGDIIKFILVIIALISIVLLFRFIIKNSNKIRAFIRSTISELRKVSWLSRKELLNYSLITIEFLIFMTLFVQFADLTFKFLRDLLI